MPGVNEVFAAAAQLVRRRLAERVEVSIEGDKVKVEMRGRPGGWMYAAGRSPALLV